MRFHLTCSGFGAHAVDQQEDVRSRLAETRRNAGCWRGFGLSIRRLLFDAAPPSARSSLVDQHAHAISFRPSAISIMGLRSGFDA